MIHEAPLRELWIAERVVQIDVLAGVRSGDTLRIRGKENDMPSDGTRNGPMRPVRGVLVRRILSGGPENATSISFHRVGAQGVLPPSPQILGSGRLLPFWLDGL
jgi:hypothetical protein